MADFLGIYVDGNILKTFCNLIEIVVAFDLFTLTCMLFASAKNEVS